MPKNIVICCDGTGNEIKTNLSNVLKLVRVAKDNDQQVVYYDPGIGTFGAGGNWSRFRHWLKKVFNLASGKGLDEDVIEAYSFLVERYEDGDQIYLFGFSRGAYTVRVLAGLIRAIGLIGPNQKNLIAYGLKAHKSVDEASKDQSPGEKFAGLNAFQKIARGRYIPIKFVGVWDTVSSVIVRRPDLIRPVSMIKLPYTATNSSVEVFRHALAIDERRRMFQANHWTPGQEFKTNPFALDGKPQDFKQVWFAGAHSDVGGGFPEVESGLSKFPLAWMIREAQEHGLLVHTQSFNRLALGTGDDEYIAPDAGAQIHHSLTLGWWPVELLPKGTQRERPRKLLGLQMPMYFPLGEPRAIEDGALIHASVEERMALVSEYKPKNLPENYTVVDDS